MLTKGEQRKIRQAMKIGAEIDPITITYETGRLVITTRPAPPVWAPALGLARLEMLDAHVYSSQFFDKPIDLLLAIRDRLNERKRMNHGNEG